MNNKFVSELLVELLHEYNRVSLPCLGSFMGQYKPSYIENGKIYPPSKQIEFHQNEIWNDERLEKLLAQKQNVSLGEAKETLAFWIDDVCVTLSKGNIINLPGFGKLTVTDGSSLAFEQAPNINFLRESFGLGTENAPVEFVPPALNVTPTNTISNINNPVDIQTKKNSWLVWLGLGFAIILCVFSILLALVHFRVINLPESYIESNPWVERYLRPDNSELENESFIFPDDEYMLSSPQANDPMVIDTFHQSLPTDTADNVQPILDSLPTETLDSTQQITQPNYIYHIVVNSFPLYDEARTLSKKLAQRGYVAQILQTNGENPYKVSIKHFDNEEEAIVYINELKETGSSGFNNISIEQQSK